MKTYLAVVTANRLAESKENLTPSVEIQVKTIKYASTGEAIAKTLTGNLWLTDKASTRTIAALAETFGWCGQSLKDLNMPVLAGVEVEVVTEEESFNGKFYEKVKFFNRPGSSNSRKLEPSDESLARTIAARYDAALRGFKQNGGVAAQVKKSTEDVSTQQNETNQAPVEDDLPF